MDFYANKIRKNFKNKFPVPGIEPGPPGWKPDILATRPYRITYTASYWNVICMEHVLLYKILMN